MVPRLRTEHTERHLLPSPPQRLGPSLELDSQQSAGNAQEAALKGYAGLHGLHLARMIRDAGASGKDLIRRGIQGLLRLLEAREVGVVLIYRLDRLSRRTRDLLELVERFEQAGVAVHSIHEHLDTQTAVGRFVLGTLASLAEMERDVIVERTREAPRHKAQMGEWVGRAPVGYRLDGSRLVADRGGRRFSDGRAGSDVVGARSG